MRQTHKGVQNSCLLVYLLGKNPDSGTLQSDLKYKRSYSCKKTTKLSDRLGGVLKSNFLYFGLKLIV